MHNRGNIFDYNITDEANKMNDNETKQARIERLKRYQEKEDLEREERKQEETIRFYTIGYANMDSIQDIKDIMDKHDITLLLDVRSKPNTKRFSKKDLTTEFGQTYTSRTEMGGFKHNLDQYQEWLKDADHGLAELLENANAGHKILIMCAEANPDSCHRKYFVARALEEGGHKVKHLRFKKTRK